MQGSSRPLRTVGQCLLFTWTLTCAAGAFAQTADELAEQAEQSARAAETAANEAVQLGATARMDRERAVEAAKKAAQAAKDARAAAKKSDTDADENAADRAEAAAKKARDEADRASSALFSATERLEIAPFLGFAVDTFAGSDVRHYLNPQDSGDQKTRETLGVTFQYPLYNDLQGRFGLWIYGQTLHGVRSTEINCDFSQPAFLNPKCKEAGVTPPDPNQTAIYLLRNASSLEGTIGLRFEFWQLQKGNAALYISRQLGFVSVEDDDDDVADVNHVGLGARIREGRFRNSFIEVGKGTNDLFPEASGDRFKVNARIVTRLREDDSGVLGKLFSRGFFFAHIVADVDGHDGPDAVQTYIGLAFCPWGTARCAGGY